MSELHIWLALAAVGVLALMYGALGIKSALCPICAVGTVVLWLTLAGCLGFLAIGATVLYAACALGAGLLAVRHMVSKKPPTPPGFGLWFFVAASATGILLLWAKQPMLYTWDEFSLWGPAAKLTILYDELYVTAPAGWDWTASQLPALYVFEYFFQYLGDGYVDWQVYAAADVLQFAAIAAMLAPIESLKKHWSLALPAAVAGLLVPFVFSGVRTAARVSAVYMDSLADIPMGLVFGAALCCWFCTGGSSWLRRLLPVGIVLGTLTLMKETGIAFALVAAAIIFFDLLFEKAENPLGGARRAKRAFGSLGVAAGAAVLPYVGWSLYMAAAAGANRLESVGGIYEMSITEMPLAFVRDLFSAGQSDFFREATGGMAGMFFTTPVWMFGSGAVAVAVILGVLALAAVLAAPGAGRRRCVVLGGFGLLGLAPYTLLITMTYIYLFRPEQLFDGYERYMYPYYIGWFLAAVAMLLHSAAAAEERDAAGGVNPGWRGLAGRAAALGLAAVLLLRVAQLIPVNYTLAGVHPQAFNEQRAFEERARALQQRLDPAGKTFLVNTEDRDGQLWFQYHYYLQPWQVDYSYGGGWAVDAQTGRGAMAADVRLADGSTVSRPVSVQHWARRLVENGCTTVYIHSANEAFRATYGGLFADDMDAYFAGRANLYAVLAAEAGVVTLVPIESGVAP